MLLSWQFLMETGDRWSYKRYVGNNIGILFRDVVSVIINSEEWKDALRNEFVSAANIRETPVRLLIKRFPDLAKDVFDKCITSNLHSSRVKKVKSKTVAPEDPQLKVKSESFSFYYRFLFIFKDCYGL